MDATLFLQMNKNVQPCKKILQKMLYLKKMEC